MAEERIMEINHCDDNFFMNAIFSIVSPKRLVWSRPILVITDKMGLIIFVLSNLPPNPVSIIAWSNYRYTTFN